VTSVFVTPLPSTHAYSGALDTYRGLAAAVVAFAHMVFWCYPVFWASKDCYPYLISYGGNKAVPVFVLLSGFLIYRSVRKVETTADLKDYVRRRFLRIYPLYVLSVVLVFAFGQMTCKPRTVIPELFMFRTLWYPGYGNPATWSLYVEAAFYVVLPLFVLMAGRWAGWAAAAAFALLSVSDPLHGPREEWVWKYFFLGIVVSHLADFAMRLGRWPAARELAGLALFAFGLKLLYHDLGYDKADWFARWLKRPSNPAGYTIGLGVGFGLVVIGTMCSRVVSRVVGVYPLRFLGTVSYSVFLLHPFYLLANFPQLKLPEVGQPTPALAAYGQAPWWYGFFFFAPGVLLWASVAYVLVERPFLKLRPRAARPEPAGRAAPDLAARRAA
jgi:peptidoglycan/LPS O-acetylase OafA/YrhL